MKNICMVVQSNYPADPRVRRQAEKLETEGYNVDIICLRKGEELSEERLGSVTAHRIFNTYNKESFGVYIFVSLSFLFLSFIKLVILSFKKKYDLLQVHNMPDFLVFAGIAFKIKRIPIILDVHDLTLELFNDKWNGKKYLLFNPIIKFTEKISYKFSDHIITVNEICKQILIRKGLSNKKVSVVLNTANTSIFKFDESRNFNVINNNAKILYHGTVAYRFGLHAAISSMVKVIERIPGSTLNIYGKYDRNYKNSLRDLIENLGLGKSIILNNSIPLESVYEMIKISDIGIVPYEYSNYMNISLSTKTFEYAASGLPVAATKLLALSNIFGDECLAFIEDLNSETLANKIIELCLDPERRRYLSINAYKSLKNISGSIMAEKYFNIIKDSINSGIS
jgi:glycosyltransferase involved in cell wall biosynthesis